MSRIKIIITLLFIFRIIIGVVAEFGDGDEFQIYLIGLKAYTTGTWPYFGPDVVYTKSQIPGALQGLLIAIPFYLLKIPESPAIFLSILTFISFGLLATYISKRFPNIKEGLIWVIIMTLPWSIYSTKMLNPAYAMIFSIPFFICIIELLSIYEKQIVNKHLAFFIIGVCTTSIMQLHLSWVLLIPFTGIAFLNQIRLNAKKIFLHILSYSLGIVLGAATLFPTLLNNEIYGGSMQSNIIFKIENWVNLPIIVARFLSFAAYEIPVILGSNTPERVAVLKDQIWMTPFTIVTLLAGFVQVGLFLFFLFKKETSIIIKKMKLIIAGTILLVYASFFFSIKGPSSYTFAMLIPLPIIYSFYCYSWLFSKVKLSERIVGVIAICALLFHIGLGTYDFKYKSIYTYKDKVVKALKEKDYTIMGLRRPDLWH